MMILNQSTWHGNQKDQKKDAISTEKNGSDSKGAISSEKNGADSKDAISSEKKCTDRLKTEQAIGIIRKGDVTSDKNKVTLHHYDTSILSKPNT